MIDFTFQNPTRIHFGRDSLNQLANEVAACGTRVLLVYGGGSIKRTGVYDKVMAQLSAANAQVWELPGVQPPAAWRLYIRAFRYAGSKTSSWC